MQPAITMAGLMLLVCVGGCLSPDDGSAGGEALTKQSATVSETLGGIQGVVTDNAVQPVQDARVVVPELDLETTTDTDGSYAFSEVPPGSYTVSVDKAGLVPASEPVEVRPDRVALVDFVMVHLASDEAYSTLLEQSGFVECGHQVGWNVTEHGTGPATAPVRQVVNDTSPVGVGDPGYFFLGLATCAVPNVLPGFTNTTNDRFIFFFELDAPVETLVYEMHWNANGPMNAWLSTVLEISGFPNDDRATFVEQDAQSPIVDRVDHGRFLTVADYLARRCEGADGGEPDPDACIGPWDAGWPLQARVFAAWQCFSEDAGACATTQQDFTHYLSAFYHEPAPEGYTISGA